MSQAEWNTNNADLTRLDALVQAVDTRREDVSGERLTESLAGQPCGGLATSLMPAASKACQQLIRSTSGLARSLLRAGHGFHA